MRRDAADKLRALIVSYWQLAYIEGKGACDHSAVDFDAYKTWTAIEAIIAEQIGDGSESGIAGVPTTAPVGHMVVPVTPSDDMLVAGQEAWWCARKERNAVEDCREAANVWAAMVRTAQIEPQSSVAPERLLDVPDGAVEVLRKSIPPDGHAVSIVFASQEAADRFHSRMDEAMKVALNTAVEVQ